MPAATKPPLFGRLLRRLCRLGERRDDIAADMLELFHTRVATVGPTDLTYAACIMRKQA